MKRVEIDLVPVKQLVLSGHKIEEISRILGVSKTTLWRRCRDADYSPQQDYMEWYAPRSSMGIKYRVIKSLPNTCEICGFDRCLEVSHIVPASEGGPLIYWNCLMLCPNHHRLFDSEKLNEAEKSMIIERIEVAHQKFYGRNK